MSDISYNKNFENEEKKMEDDSIKLQQLNLKKKRHKKIQIIEQENNENNIQELKNLLNKLKEQNLIIKHNVNLINKIDENSFRINLNRNIYEDSSERKFIDKKKKEMNKMIIKKYLKNLKMI